MSEEYPPSGEEYDEDGPADPQLDPERSPGFEEATEISEIDVGRDVTLGEADPEELTASDISRVQDEEVSSLLEDLRDGPSPDRQRAALALAERGGGLGEDAGTVAEALAVAARTDGEPDVRQFAVEALGKVGGDVAEATARAVATDDEPWVRAEAVVALDRLDREAHAESIDDAIGDDHHAVRRNALISQFKREGEDALPALLSLVEDDSERVREWAAHMLGGVDDDRAREALEERAEDDDSRIVRATAARARSVDPGRFRRQFTGALDERDPTLPGEDRLNRRPDL